MVGTLAHHFLPEHFAYQPGNARVLLGRLYSCPAGDFFIQGNGNVFHNSNIVQHQICVNIFIILIWIIKVKQTESFILSRTDKKMKKAGAILLGLLIVSAGFCGWAEGQGPQPGSTGIEKATSGVKAPPPAMVMICNRPIVAFRDTLFGSSPQQRARRAEERINALIESGRSGPALSSL